MQLSQLQEESLKKLINIQVCVGFKPLTTAMVSPTELFTCTSQLRMNQPKNQLQMAISEF